MEIKYSDFELVFLPPHGFEESSFGHSIVNVIAGRRYYLCRDGGKVTPVFEDVEAYMPKFFKSSTVFHHDEVSIVDLVFGKEC